MTTSKKKSSYFIKMDSYNKVNHFSMHKKKEKIVFLLLEAVAEKIVVFCC